MSYLSGVSFNDFFTEQTKYGQYHWIIKPIINGNFKLTERQADILIKKLNRFRIEIYLNNGSYFSIRIN